MTKHPVVVLHGWGLSAARFDGLKKELKKEGFTVHIPDFPGFGDSAMPSKPLHLTDYAIFLDEYLKTQKLKEPIIIGHSFGGRVALVHEKLYPGKIFALVLTGTPGFTPVAKRKLMLFIAIAKAGKLVLSLPILNLVQEKIRRWYYYFVGAREYFRAEGSMRETFKNVVRQDLAESMESVHVPTLLLWGENDIITPVWIAQKMKTRIPGATLTVIPDVDHGVPYKEPQKFVQAFLAWVSTL